ncbi:4-diphosphocytidyl-2C-methyl-D-erythritol 2-phosphate synthase [alpha proteobacterium HIMB114]|nr:4-diphosphocytidyl-2C-methyl-D-erythritol 2-phosphate synthase [alpha proteobacterium HIMB114]
MNKIKSFAKVNLFLKVVGKSKNYHNLYSLISQINLFDEITIKETSAKKSKFLFTGPFKIKSEKNTISDLIYLMKKKFLNLKDKNFIVRVKKNIPNGSGLGGASSNAVTVFKYLKKKYKLKIPYKESLKLLAKIGKDCPLFIDNKVKLIKSSGERYVKFHNKLNLKLLIIFPNQSISTEEVFNKLNKFSKISINKKINLAKKLSLINLCKLYKNDLFTPASRISKKIIDLSKMLDKLDCISYYSMTGSGSAFFVICDTKKSLLNIQKMIKKQKKAFWTTIAKTI